MTEQALDQHLDQLSADELLEKEVKDKLRELAHTKWLLGNRAMDLQLAQDYLEQTPEYFEVNELTKEIKELQQSEANLNANIKTATLQLSELSGYADRKPVSGVQIKEFTVVEILDEKKAKIWASQNAPDTISLSKSKFDKVAKVLDLDFVKTGTEYRAQVASDLSNYLDENTTLHSSTTTEE